MQCHHPDCDDGDSEKTVQEEERPEGITHEWVGFEHTVKGSSDTPLSQQMIIYNSTDLNREVNSQHHPTTQLAGLPTAGTAGNQSTCYARIGYATMSICSHFKAGLVMLGRSVPEDAFDDSAVTMVKISAERFIDRPISCLFSVLLKRTAVCFRGSVLPL